MPTQITTHHAGRHTGSPHQSGQGTGVVTAEPHVLIKQKRIQINNRTGLQAVPEGLTRNQSSAAANRSRP